MFFLLVLTFSWFATPLLIATVHFHTHLLSLLMNLRPHSFTPKSGSPFQYVPRNVQLVVGKGKCEALWLNRNGDALARRCAVRRTSTTGQEQESGAANRPATAHPTEHQWVRLDTPEAVASKMKREDMANTADAAVALMLSARQPITATRPCMPTLKQLSEFRRRIPKPAASASAVVVSGSKTAGAVAKKTSSKNKMGKKRAAKKFPARRKRAAEKETTPPPPPVPRAYLDDRRVVVPGISPRDDGPVAFTYPTAKRPTCNLDMLAGLSALGGTAAANTAKKPRLAAPEPEAAASGGGNGGGGGGGGKTDGGASKKAAPVTAAAVVIDAGALAR